VKSEEPLRVVKEVERGQRVYEDFKVVKEDWNSYKLSDGTLLKIRQILLKVQKDRNAKPPQPNLSIQTSDVLMAVNPLSNLKGTPSTQQYSVQELNASVVEANMKFNRIYETTYEYVTTEGFRIALHLSHRMCRRQTSLMLLAILCMS
jgi:hypothetical protein